MSDYFKVIQDEIDKANVDIANAPYFCEEEGSDIAIDILSRRIATLCSVLSDVSDQWKWDCTELRKMVDSLIDA